MSQIRVGNDKKTIRREGVELTKRVVNYVLFSVTCFYNTTKWFKTAGFYKLKNVQNSKYLYITNIVCKKWFLFQVYIKKIDKREQTRWGCKSS